MQPERILPVFAILLATAVAAAQQWTLQNPPASPPARATHAMATDLAAGKVVLFGGAVGTTYLGDTWTYDGANWAQVMGAGPAARGRHAMATDLGRGVVVMFGGINGISTSSWFGDTWEYSAGTWTQRASTNHPAVRFGHAMAYDETRSRVVMFGGRTRSGTIFLGDTWEWDGSNWLPMTAAASPTPRMGHTMAFDPLLGQVVLFGGLQLGGPYMNDTWTWNGVTWTQLSPLHAPTPRGDATMATDVRRGRLVMFGGHDTADFADTWEWNGADWTSVPTTVSPAALTLPAMTAGPHGRNVVLFGGDDANGIPQAASWNFGFLATATAFGTGCGASPLVLAASPGSAPEIGRPFQSEFGPVPAGALPFQSLGYSATTFGGTPLPLALDNVGMTGCTLYHDLAQIFLPCTLAGSVATNVLQVPNDPALVGYKGYLQGYALGVSDNAAGIIATNALRLQAGYL